MQLIILLLILDKEIKIIEDHCSKLGVKASLCMHWAKGGEGTKDLANNVVELCAKSKKNNLNFYILRKDSLWKKIEAIAKEIYGCK